MIRIPSEPRVRGAWIVGLTSLIVYAVTIAPTVAFWDVGEFLAASYSLGITHPPAAPTFVLLGRLFAMLPLPFNVAVQVNLISGEVTWSADASQTGAHSIEIVVEDSEGARTVQAFELVVSGADATAPAAAAP